MHMVLFRFVFHFSSLLLHKENSLVRKELCYYIFYQSGIDSRKLLVRFFLLRLVVVDRESQKVGERTSENVPALIASKVERALANSIA